MLQNSKVVIIHGCSFDKEKAQDPKRRTHDKHWYPWLKKAVVDLYKEKLNARVVSIKGYGHYITGDMGKTKFPEILKEIKK